MIIDASNCNVSDLKIIASNASGKGIIVLRNAGHINVADLKIIASNSKGSVIFDLTD
ncbi:MAG: hypothetical protein QOG51_1258 [Verrucomicrobiota bacterium]|jgi:hypothetical protein